MTRFAFVIDLDRCTGCQTCEVACKNENGIALGQYWNKVIERGPFGTFPEIEKYWLPLNCQQCENAPCVHVCPTGASYRSEENGLVLVNKEVCIGCRYCTMACPYGVRTWNSAEKVVEKCTTCAHLDTPFCVQTCPNECRFFGDLDDPSSDAAQALAAEDAANVHQLPDVGNGPGTYYILNKRIATWREEI